MYVCPTLFLSIYELMNMLAGPISSLLWIAQQ